MTEEQKHMRLKLQDLTRGQMKYQSLLDLDDPDAELTLQQVAIRVQKILDVPVGLSQVGPEDIRIILGALKKVLSPLFRETNCLNCLDTGYRLVLARATPSVSADFVRCSYCVKGQKDRKAAVGVDDEV